MCRKNPWAYLTMLLAVAGCAAPPKDAAWPPRRPLGGDIAAYVPPQKPPADPTPPEFQEPTGVVDLRTAWSAALISQTMSCRVSPAACVGMLTSQTTS